MFAQGSAGMEGAEETAVLEEGHGAVDDPFEVALRGDGREVEAVGRTRPVPLGDEVGQVDRAAPEVGAPPGELRSALQAGFRCRLDVPEVDRQRDQDPQRVGVAPVGGRPGAQFVPDRGGLLGVVARMWTTSACRAAAALAGALVASMTVTGLPWGGRGTIAGPRTEKVEPSKST